MLQFLMQFFILFSLTPCLAIEPIEHKEKNKCSSAKSQSLDANQRAELILTNKIYNQGHLSLNYEDTKVEVHTVNVVTNGQKLPLKVYRHPSLKTPSKGTVIFLCGGPSVCLKNRPANIPPDFDVIGSDYIGLGLNTLAPTPAEMMSIEGQALATKKIIEAFKLKQYVIYGGSFGTAVATVTAHLIDQDSKMSPPKSIILEGTASFPMSQDFVTASNKALNLLSDEEKARFSKKYKELLLSGNQKKISDLNLALTMNLGLGPLSVSNVIKQFSNYTESSLNEFISGGISNFTEKKLESQYSRMYRASSCQFFNIENHDNQVEGDLFGGLVKNPFSRGQAPFCNCRTINRDFDPKNFPIKTPILYINGDADPFTPLEDAKNHMRGQTQAKSKTLLVAKNEGH